MKLIRLAVFFLSLLVMSCTVTIERPAAGSRPKLQPVRQSASAATVVPLPARQPTSTPLAPAVSLSADAVEALFVNVYQRVSPAVVHVEVTTDRDFQGQPRASGSGFVLDQEGHIVTNNHVIADARRIRVIFADGTHVEAEVVGADPAIDLAVIKVNVARDALVPVELGNSDALRVGQRAIAIGSPFQFDQSMTVGIVSALGRVVEPDDAVDFVPEMIQTDAAINPGNSGGPLLNSKGQVIGINTLIFSETGTSSGVGFAIPVNTLRRSLAALLAGREVGAPWLGIAGPSELTNLMVDELDLMTGEGAYVNYVVPGGPADEAGVVGASPSQNGTLQPGGDLIVAVDDVEVDSLDSLLSYLAGHTRVGQTVELTVIRNKEPKTIPVTLGERPGN